MITLLFSMTLVSTFCCSVDFKLPLSCAFFRIRCTASITSPCCARNALPRSVVHWISSARRFTTSGKAANAWIPRLFRGRIGQRLILQVLVFLQPLLELDDFQRICRCCQGLGEQRIWI